MGLSALPGDELDVLLPLIHRRALAPPVGNVMFANKLQTSCAAVLSKLKLQEGLETSAALLCDGSWGKQNRLPIAVEEIALANFTESNASFVVAEVSGSSTLSLLDIDIDASGFTSGTGTWAVNLSGNNVLLNYTAGASDPYTTWAAGFPSLTGGFEADDDGDGVANGLEYYFFDSDPTVAEGLGSPLTVASAAGAGDLVFSHQRPVDGTGITATYEWSTTLNSDWTPSGTANGGLTVTITPGTPTPAATGYETVTVTTSSVPTTVGKFFVRVFLTMPSAISCHTIHKKPSISRGLFLWGG